MPVYDIPAAGSAWTFDADLSNAVGAAGFRVRYRSRKPDGSFDPLYFAGIRVFRGEANPDLVRIRPRVEGLEETLVLGVVDRNGTARGDETSVAGSLTGRDLIALALDRYPAAAFTLAGLAVQPGGALGYGETFQTAVRRLAQEAGLAVLFDCRDYKLGKPLPVTTDRTVAEYLAALLAPLRWAEKRRTDVWIEGNTLRVAERGRNARGTVQVRAERVLLEALEKTALPAVDGVRVEGATYEVEEDDAPQGAAIAGLPFGTPYTTSFGPFTVTKTAGGKTTTYIDEGQDWYDEAGRLLHSFRKVTYLLMDSLPTSRVESWEKDCTFWVDSTRPYDGAPKTESEIFRVLDVWSTAGGGKQAGTEIVREKDTDWRYFEDTGDVLAEDGFEVEKDESGKTLPLAVRTQRTWRYRYRRSKGRVLRDWEIVEFDPATGAVSRTFGNTEVGAFNADAGRPPLAARAGKRMASRRISAGPEATSGRFRLEQSEMLGAAADCEAVRQDLIDEHASVRIGAAFSMAPDLRVKVGKTLEVLGAPAWWPASSFLVTAVHAEASGEGRMSMRVETVAWAAAP